MHFEAFLRFYTVTLNPPLTCQHTAEIQLQFTLCMLFFLLPLLNSVISGIPRYSALTIIVLQGSFVLQHSVYNFLHLHETIYFQNSMLTVQA